MQSFRIFVLLAPAFFAGFALTPAAAGASILAFPQGSRQVNVSVGFNTQVPLPDLTPESLTGPQKAGREYLYRLAREECTLLEATIAETCRLTGLNINTQVQHHNNAQPLLYINGNASFTITLKEDADPKDGAAAGD